MKKKKEMTTMKDNFWMQRLKDAETVSLMLPQGNMLNLLFQFRGEMASYVRDTDLPLKQFPGMRKQERIQYLTRRVFGRIKRVVNQMFEDGQALIAMEIVEKVGNEVAAQITKKVNDAALKKMGYKLPENVAK